MNTCSSVPYLEKAEDKHVGHRLRITALPAERMNGPKTIELENDEVLRVMFKVEGLAHNFAFGPALYGDLRPPSRCQPAQFVCLSRVAIEHYPK